MIFKLLYKKAGSHVHARMFVGPEEGRLALSGTLVFHWKEWENFIAVWTFERELIGDQMFYKIPNDRDSFDRPLVGEMISTHAREDDEWDPGDAKPLKVSRVEMQPGEFASIPKATGSDIGYEEGLILTQSKRPVAIVPWADADFLLRNATKMHEERKEKS